MKSIELDNKKINYLNSIQEPIIVTDINGYLSLMNTLAEKITGINFENSKPIHISKIITPVNKKIKIETIVSDIVTGNNYSKRIAIFINNKTTEEFNLQCSALLNSDNQVIGTVNQFEKITELPSNLSIIEKLNKLISELSDNYEENINKITALTGEILGASCALYNRLDSNLLHSLGQWNVPEDYLSSSPADGHICFDLIKMKSNEVYYVPELDQTSYFTSDINVSKYGLKTYIGHKVRCNGEAVGSLCVIYQTNIDYNETFALVLRLLATAMENVETRETLRKSKEEHENLFNFAAEGILVLSTDLVITEANKSIVALTGFSREELLGKKITDLLIDFDKTKIQDNELGNPMLNTTLLQTANITCKNGQIIFVESQTQLLQDNTYQTIIIDITEQQESKKRLDFSESTYQGIFNSLNDAVYILDKNALFLDVNAGAEKMYGYSRQEFIGKSPEFLSAPSKNDTAQTIQNINDAYNGSNILFEYWGKRKDGSEFPKEVSLSPGMWFGEKVIIALGRNISERKAADEKLRISEEKYRLLVQYSSDPIFSFNPDESYRFVNEAFALQFGKKPEDIIGKTPYEIFSKEEAEKRLGLIRKVFGTAQKGEIEVRIVNNKNEIKYYLTMVDPIKDHEGKVMWVTCISKDITLRKQAEEELRLKNEQLKSTNAEKDKFFSIVAHDLRGPMNGFLGLTGIMVEDIESLSANELKEIANTMRTSAVNIYRLIENLLEWSRLQRGVINFEPQPMFLKSSLNKSIELVRDTADKKDIYIEINIPEHMVVNADLHMLETVIRNLLSNAIKFSLRGGSIQINAFKTENRMICIEVADHGIGIPDELVQKLFSIAENTSRKGTENEPSTGLGLILCKEFIEKQGGVIEVESQETMGSTFRFTIPQL